MEVANNAAPDWLERERQKWRRFEPVVDDGDQLFELNQIIQEKRLTRRELAVIAAALRVRPGFSLKDFDT